MRNCAPHSHIVIARNAKLRAASILTDNKQSADIRVDYIDELRVGFVQSNGSVIVVKSRVSWVES